jgi:hypothetical protein
MSEMRLTESHLRQLIREFLILEADSMTVGDLRQALSYAKGKKAKAAAAEFAKEAGKKAGLAGVKTVLSFIPGAAGVADYIEKGADIADLAKAAKDSLSPKEKKTNPLWDKLSIDPQTAAIVDDGVEDQFIVDLGRMIDGMSDDSEIPNADTQLASWLKSRYSGRHITSGD